MKWVSWSHHPCVFFQAQEDSEVVDPPPAMTTEVTVLLEDVNDETPTFKAAHYVAEIAEGAQFNSPVNLIGDAIPEVYDHDQVGLATSGKTSCIHLVKPHWWESTPFMDMQGF